MELGPGTDLGFYITPPSALSAVKVLICWAVKNICQRPYSHTRYSSMCLGECAHPRLVPCR